ncbi:hypothetical protein [Salipiger abyssi]|nr:hypothetical protein [Salipiger abyssi]
MRRGLKMIAAAGAILVALPLLKDAQGGPSLWHRAEARQRNAGIEEALAPRAPYQAGLMPVRRSTVNDHEMRAFARFRVEALVLSRHDYRFDRTAGFSSTDLALGWGPMSTPARVEEVEISQARRFYYWRPKPGAQLSARQIRTSSANMHLVLQSAAQREALKQIGKGDLVVIEGYLVDVEAPSGMRWRSSRTRNDAGAGACEIILVETIRRVAPEVEKAV